MPDRIRSGACLLLLILLSTVASGQSTTAFDEFGYQEAISTILCDCGCHPQTVKDCACGRAAQMRDEMRSMIAGGMSGDDVIEDYVARNGEQIRIAPVASGFNLVAWLGPLLGLALACFGLFWIIRRWNRNSSPDDREDVQDAAIAGDDDPYREKLRAAMERME